MKILKTLLLLCSLIFTLQADDEEYKHKKNHIYKNLDYLNLNKKQFKQFKKILISYKHDYKNFYTYKKGQEKRLQNLIQKEFFNKEKYIKTIQDIQKKAIKLEAEKLERIHTLLNKKQRIKFSSTLQEWEIE